MAELLLEHRRKRFVRSEPETGGEAVAEDHDDGLGAGGGLRDDDEREQRSDEESPRAGEGHIPSVVWEE